MGIPKKGLRHSQLIYSTKTAISDSSHQTFPVTFEEDGVIKKAFFKKLEPNRHYPELLAKISVATSSFKRLFQGKRSAEERLVFEEYGIELLSESNETIKENTLYIKLEKETLKYIVKTPEGLTKIDSIEVKEIPELNLSQPLMEQLPTLKSHILEITSKRGHTEDKLIGTLSIGIEDFKPFHFASERIPVNSTLKEQVAPSVKTLIEHDIMELLFGRWFLDDDDSHPHNLSLAGDIDFDMFFYWFTIHMKEPRAVIGVPKTHVTLTVRDYESFPNVQESMPYHWPPYQHPGQVTIPVIVPGVQEQALKKLPKAYADPVEFARLAQSSLAQEQKVAAALKALLTYQPEVQRKRLTELFGDLPLNYTSLEETNPELRKKYEELYPQFCNEETNKKPFVDFIMDLYQEHYDNLYRVVVFYMGCLDNGYGIPLAATYLSLYQKPSFYRKIEEWVKKQNETVYAKDEAMQYDLGELQKRYHQVWRDAFTPIIKELLYSSYRLTNTLLKETTNPPHVQISELVSKKVTDDTLTSAWELFGNLPVLSPEAIEARISVDKDSKLRDAVLSLVSFINEFQALIKGYYEKERKDLTEEDNLEFSNKLSLLYQTHNLKVRQALANTTTYAAEFNNIASSLKLIAEQVNFQLHLTTTDELMEKALLAVKRDVLPFTHEDIKQQYYDSLFVWAKTIKPEDLERHINEIIDKKYAPLITSISFRQRAEPMKEYLRNSTNERGDNRLAYILSAGRQDGELNMLLIKGLTPLMLQTFPIPSIDNAMRDKEKSFENGIADFTRDVVFFAKKDKRFNHPYSDVGISMLYKTMYEWVDSLTERSFRSLIESSLKKYESQSWGSLWGASRRAEVEGYLKGNCNSKALAIIFMNGLDTSSLNECLFVKIIETIKKEIGKYPGMLQEEKYKLIEQFNLEEHKVFYLANLKYHQETIAASHRQLQLTDACTY
ncbi:hypothetical protein OQJ15_14005 [Fluoribacter dumoffii]|uniref:Uncharacterized protein n=1 Tax=Fluoribacter dumoffii TaxID=463 RepID=A0A377GEE5_9GAMM|nr:hypothetical protein [Fluoribacter dumoffii]KTC91458.1 hypothetical protein Ldum_2526 [Fluoribacter dumoffii NY 23]MCW8387420.1 hypothetical protein [Fluoribacter dumoffii]MCW8497624.1 hypothetical protein [Fluoribacter dumoffii]STO23162.1 Uncharacterised protein [Fluoribacter dumoffii]